MGYEMQRVGGVAGRCGDEGVTVELHGLIAKPTSAPVLSQNVNTDSQ